MNEVKRPNVSKNLDKDKLGIAKKVAISFLAVTLVAGLSFLFYNSRGDISYKHKIQDVEFYSISNLSTKVIDDNTYSFTKNESAPVLDIYEDPACPVCKSLEETYGAEINKAIDSGEITLNVHQVDILSQINSEYSTKMVLVYKEAASINKDNIYKFREWVYVNQPSEGFQLTDEQLKEGLVKSGYSSEEADTIIQKSQKDNYPSVKSSIEESEKVMMEVTGKIGTPTLIHEGKQVMPSDSNWLTNIIDNK